MNLIELLEEKGLEPRRTASIDGGEYHSACPNCGGTDRFAIWPNSKANKCVGRYWCRQCDIRGDSIEFCRAYLNLSWKEACAKLHVDSSSYQRLGGAIKRSEKVIKLAKDPCQLWQQQAGLFVARCHDILLKTPKVMAPLYARGFTNESIRKFKIGYNNKNEWHEYQEWGLKPEVKNDGRFRKLWLPHGWLLPWFDATGCVLKIKIRYENYENELRQYEEGILDGMKGLWEPQKYIIVKGGIVCPVIYGDRTLKVGILVESEFDALVIQQFAGDICFSIATGGSRQNIDLATDRLIRQTFLILLCPDDDEGGDFLVSLQDDYENMKLWPAPVGKSPGDALKEHGINLREWIMQGIPTVLLNQMIGSHT